MKKTFTEIHLHTKETSRCSWVSAELSVPMFKDYGYECLVVTDHYNADYFTEYYNGELSYEDALNKWLLGYETAKRIGDDIGITVLLGAEIRFDGCNDYLVYGLSKELLLKYPCLWELGVEKFSDFAREHHLFFAQAHPFRDKMTRCNPLLLDGCEVFNAHPYHDSRNIYAGIFASDNNLIPICGSDYHYKEGLCGCGINFYGEVKTVFDIRDKLFSREYDLVIPSSYTTRQKPEKYKRKK